MTKEQLLNAIKNAKEILCAVRYSSDEFAYVKVSKSEVRHMINTSGYGGQFDAMWSNRCPTTLLIG